MSEDNAITFICPHCSQSLEAETDMAGELIECPACQKTITIPQAPQKKPKLALRQPPAAARRPTPPPSASLACKYCGAQHGADAVFCVGCGRNLRTGKPLQTRTETPRPQRPASSGISGGALLFLIILAVGGYFGWKHLNQSGPRQAGGSPQRPSQTQSTMPSEFRASLIQFLELAAELNASTEVGVNRRDFSASYARLKSKADILFAQWPSGFEPQAKQEMQKALYGYALAIEMWSHEHVTLGNKSLWDRLKGYGVEPYDGWYIPGIAVPAIFGEAGSHYSAGNTRLLAAISTTQ